MSTNYYHPRHVNLSCMSGAICINIVEDIYTRDYWVHPDKVTVEWSFMTYVLSVLEPEALDRLYWASVERRQERIDQAYANWDLSKEMLDGDVQASKPRVVQGTVSTKA